MDAEAAKLLGAGLAAIGAGLASIGVGNVFAKFLEGALRNPGAADGQQVVCSSASPLPNFLACWHSLSPRCSSSSEHDGPGCPGVMSVATRSRVAA